MRILVVAAVDFELEAARCLQGGLDVTFLRAGVGSGQTVRSLEPLLETGSFDRVLDIGIAGGYVEHLPLGSVVHVIEERHSDIAPDALLRNPEPWPELSFLPSAKGNTLQTLDDRYRAIPTDVETMEGAAFFEVCLRHGVSFAEIRAVSNVVGERDHARWDIPAALSGLESALKTLKASLL